MWIVCCVFALTACGQKNEGELLTEETLKEGKNEQEMYFEENGYWQEKDSSSEKDVYVGAMPEEEMDEYGIQTTSCVSIVALIKNETISHIILDMPTA